MGKGLVQAERRTPRAKRQPFRRGNKIESALMGVATFFNFGLSWQSSPASIAFISSCFSQVPASFRKLTEPMKTSILPVLGLIAAANSASAVTVLLNDQFTDGERLT